MLPGQYYLARLVGWRNGRPLYATVCDPPKPGYHLARLVGWKNGRPLYAIGNCVLPTGGGGYLPTGNYLARLCGWRNGRPLYAVY